MTSPRRHRAGDERAWWQAAGIEPVKVARKLWKHTRVKEGRIRQDSDRTVKSQHTDGTTTG
jgi:hypothetical protein